MGASTERQPGAPTKREEVISLVRGMIADGTLLPGAVAPSRAELARISGEEYEEAVIRLADPWPCIGPNGWQKSALHLGKSNSWPVPWYGTNGAQRTTKGMEYQPSGLPITTTPWPHFPV